MANEKILEAKKAVAAELAEKLKKSNAVVLVDYRGINVTDDTALRKEMREAGVEYKVIKNSILSHACDLVGMSELDKEVKGTIAVAISEDEIAPCRILHKYADRFTDKFNIKTGFIDGHKVDTTVTKSLSKLPSRDAIFGQLAGTLNSIVGSLAVALNEVANKMQA